MVSPIFIPHACGKVCTMKQVGTNNFEMVCIFCNKTIGDWKYTPRKRYPKKKEFTEAQKDLLK